MAARQSAMRPGGGGARFAQFKLVLLGMSLHVCAAQYDSTNAHSVPAGESAVGKSSLVLRFVKVCMAIYRASAPHDSRSFR